MLLLLGIGTMMSCDSLIYDDLSNCPTGVYVNFFSKTPCAKDSSYLGEVSKLHLFAFENDSLLADYKVLDKPTLSKEYTTLMNLPQGAYKFYAWAGAENSLFELPDFRRGVTKKEDLMYTLKTENGKAADLTSKRLWGGENNSVVVLKDPAENGTDYQHTAVNLLEKTNRVNVELVIDESIYRSIATTKPQDFRIELLAGNTQGNINATMPKGQAQVTYPSKVEYKEKSAIFSYNILDIQSGYNSILRLHNLQKNVDIKGAEDKDIDLIAAIHFLALQKNIDLSCMHDFNIKVLVKDKCADCGTFMCQIIQINDWEVHSYVWTPGADL
ncbi:MAG: FimB/Mfa2 family fimbrial subunit [Bacteroidales bacterium]|nr:FimB/Mfa2 family fimbrial subunit [Bacteroidales bacterium]